MTMAERFQTELEALTKRHSEASWISNANISQSTRDHYLEMQSKELGDLIKKYNPKITVLNSVGPVKNERYEFSDGSFFDSKLV